MIIKIPASVNVGSLFRTFRSSSFNYSLTMAPEEGRNVRNKLLTMTLVVIFMIKIVNDFFFEVYTIDVTVVNAKIVF